MLVRVGIALACSVAAFTLNNILRKRDAAAESLARADKKQRNEVHEKDIDASRFASSKEEEEEEVKQINVVKHVTSREANALLLPEVDDLFSGNLDMFPEAKSDEAELLARVKRLQEREKCLEAEVRDYHEVKQKVERIGVLEAELCAKSQEIAELRERIRQVELERMKLNEEIAATGNVKRDLTEARMKVKELQKQLMNETGKNKSELIMLKQQVATLQAKDQDASKRNLDTEKKMQALKELEVEVMELRRTCKELQHQKRDLTVKLSAAEAQVASLSSVTESDIVAQAKYDAQVLKHANEDLVRQVEGLQNNRFSEVEELVYLRWVNACLRYELRNYKAPDGKITALDLNKSLSPRSQERAKLLMLEYANPDLLTSKSRVSDIESGYDSASSQLSTSSESVDYDDASSEHTSGSKKSLIKRLKKWGRSKDDSQVPSPKVENKPSTPDSPLGALETIILRNSKDSGITTFGAHSPTRSSTDTPSAPKLTVKTKRDAVPTDVAASFQLMQRSVIGTEVAEKYPAYKDRHKLALEREKVIKEKVETIAATKKSEAVMKMTPAEVAKREVRKANPPPKPSSAAPIASVLPPMLAVGTSVQGRSAVPPPPPPLPPRPGAPGVPPPPPPPPPSGMAKSQQAGSKVRRAPEVVEFYQSLMKRDAKKEAAVSTSVDVTEARGNLIGEIENRSSHLLAIKADVETQGDFVNSLAAEVRAAVYANIDDVVAFVNWLDDELAFLVDERAVLKHFDWPEAKADTLREAAFEYQDLKKLEAEVSSYQDDPKMPRDAAFKRMMTLLDKVEQNVYALLRTRDMAIARYKEFNVPSYWLLDTGLIGKIKLASVRLAQLFMKRVVHELDSVAAVQEKEPLREFLLLQGVRFAFRVHQFAGGFDPESMRTFEELRSRAQNERK